MTVKEKDYCLDLLLEGLRYANMSKECFNKLNDSTMKYSDKELAKLQGHNYLGYAQGIFQSLSVIRYEHKQMNVLRKMI